MTYDEITAKVNAYTLKAGVTVKYNFDKYGSTQVEFRNDALIWRGWSFEADFAYYLDRELAIVGVKKSDAEIAELEAAARANRLRNDAIFSQDMGYDAIFCPEFTKEEIDAEIAVMNGELTALESYCIAAAKLRPSHVHRADYATDAEYSAAKVAFYSRIIRDLWSERKTPLYRRQIRKTLKSLRDWKAVARKDADAEKYSHPGLLSGPLVRITSQGGAFYTALMSAVQVIPESGRLLATWDYRYQLCHNPSFKTGINAAMVERIEYAR